MILRGEKNVSLIKDYHETGEHSRVTNTLAQIVNCKTLTDPL